MKQFMSYSSFKGFLKNRYVLSGLVVRFVISLFFAHMYDFNVFINATREFFYFGTITYFVKWAYGLLAYLILLGSYFPATLFPDYIFTFGQNWMLSEKFFIKLPLNISDIFISYILYCIMIENGKKRYAMSLALLYWLNPLSIYVSSIYGTIDAITVFFGLLAFYHFVHEKYYLSALELGLGFGMKYQTLILVPIFLVLLWRDARRKIPIFLLILVLLFIFSFLLPAFVYYDPDTHYLALTFFPLNIYYTRALPVGHRLINPNMSYLSLLNRSDLRGILPAYNDILAWMVFAIFFSMFTYLIFKKSPFDYRQSKVNFLAAYSVGTYMIFYLTYLKVHQHYALWVLPYLIILFSFGYLNRFLFIVFNFLPLVQGLHGRDTIFYYINESYTAYGVNWAAAIAIGFLFSLSCLLIIQDLFKETLIKKYQRIKKLFLFFRRSLNEKTEVAFTLLLILTFLLIITSIYITGPPYWSTYPISRFYPLEWLIIPSLMQVTLFYILLFDVTPLALLLSLSLNNKNIERTSSVKSWKYILFLVLIALAVFVASFILQLTLPYVDYSLLYSLIGSPKFFHGWVPVGGTFRVLIEHGGFITTIFLLLAILLAIDILLPRNIKSYEVVYQTFVNNRYSTDQI